MKKAKLIFIVSTIWMLSAGVVFAQGDSPETIPPQTSGENIPRINISPNPVHGNTFFYVEVDSCSQNSINNLLIYNSSGFVVQNKNVELREGNNRLLVNISGVQPGYYVFRLTGKNIPSLSFS